MKHVLSTDMNKNQIQISLRTSRKLYKLDEADTQDTAGEARTNSSVIYYGPRIWPSKSRTTSSNIHTVAM